MKISTVELNENVCIYDNDCVPEDYECCSPETNDDGTCDPFEDDDYE